MSDADDTWFLAHKMKYHKRIENADALIGREWKVFYEYDKID